MEQMERCARYRLWSRAARDWASVLLYGTLALLATYLSESAMGCEGQGLVFITVVTIYATARHGGACGFLAATALALALVGLGLQHYGDRELVGDDTIPLVTHLWLVVGFAWFVFHRE